MAGSLGTNVGSIYYNCTVDTSDLIGQTRVVERETGKMAGAFSAITKAISVLAVALAAVKVARMADDIRMLGARVEVAAGSVEKGSEAFNELVNISRRTRSSLEGNIEVFNRLNQSILQMGGTQADTLNVTELLGKAIKVSGASAVEAKAAMLQFGQALGSGKLQGDELRSLMETAPYLMRQLADGIGVPVGALKKLGEEGKLTADVVTNALTKAATKIDDDFKKLPPTFEAALVVAQDQAALAALALDNLTGSSAALAGSTKGLGEVLEQLAAQFSSATSESDKLGRNDSVTTWANATRTVLSYVVDAGDFVVRMFRQMGTLIAGVAAATTQLASGELINAAKTIAAMKKDVDSIGNAKYAGAAMRDAFASGQAPAAPTKPSGNKLKSPAGSTDSKAKKFDSEGYLADLRKQTLQGVELVAAIEQEALRKNDERLKKREISEKQHAEAVTLIESRAAQDRQEIQMAAGEEYRKAIEQDAEKEKQARQKATEYAAGVTRAINPIDALRQEYEAKLQLVTQYEQLMAQAGVDATMQGQVARTEISRQYELQRQALAEQSFRSQGEAQAFLLDSLNSLGQTATSSIMGLINGTMTAQEAMRGLANTVLNEAVGALVQIGVQQIKNALTAKTLEAAEKARAAASGAVYAASVSAQVAGMSAMAAQNAFAATAAIPIIGPGLAPAAAAAAGAAAAAIGAPAIATAPLAGARQYGGPVDSGSMYRVGEGNRPEMFVGDSGRSYMIPGERGKVIGNGDLGGGALAPIVNIYQAPAETTTRTSRDSEGRWVVDVMLNAVADDLSSGGKTARAVQSRFNLR